MSPITKADVINQDPFMRQTFHAGTCVTLTTPRNAETTITEVWRANGACKQWKTRPDEFKLPIKYGLRECWYLTNDNAASFHRSDQCTPTVFEVHSMRPALDVITQTRRDHYRVGSAPRAEHYRLALENAGLIVGVDAPTQRTPKPCTRHHLHDASCARRVEVHAPSA